MQLVLLVEDDVVLRTAMARALGKLPSIEVVEAGSLAEASRLIRGLTIDLVVADIELRDGTVLDILPLIDARRVAAVLVSGHIDEFATRLPSGLALYPKPLSAAALRQLVATRLGGGDARSPIAAPLPASPRRRPAGSQATRREPRTDDLDLEFDRLYAMGIDALLTKRYREAFEMLSRARRIRTTASLDANLKRLRALGFTGEKP